MLGRNNRLLTSDEFREVFRRGKKRTITSGAVAFLTNDAETVRWGFVVPKVVGSAVVRNLVKRRLRAAANDVTSSLVGVDVVVRAKPGAESVPVHQWASELAVALGIRP